MNPLINYLYQQALPAPLAPSTKQAQETAPVLAVVEKPLLCAIRLPYKHVYLANGVVDIRPQWSSTVYPVLGFKGDWVLIHYMHGTLYRKIADVRVKGMEAVAKAVA